MLDDVISYIGNFFNVTRGGTEIFFFSIILSLLLGLFISYFYKKTHYSYNFEDSFLTTLVVLPAIVTLVMFYIQGDLVLSLGLVGSLSIIRFRTPIKDTRDMIFLFLSIAIGLGCGTYNGFYSIIAVLILSITFTILKVANYGKKYHSDYILIIQGNKEVTNKINNILEKHKLSLFLRSHDLNEDFWELVYEFRVNPKIKFEYANLITEIKNIKGIEKVSLLTPQLPLPM